MQEQRRQRRAPADVQELLDGLLYMQGQAQTAEGRTYPSGDAMGKRKELLEWFGKLSVEERVRLLHLDEPAFVKLLVMLARKAHGLPTRRGRRPCLVKFFVFAEAVPALAAHRVSRYQRSHGSKKERRTTATTTGPADLFGEEPFVVRPDESRETAWGDALRLPTRPATWRAWETLVEKLLLFLPWGDSHGQETNPVGIFSASLVENAEAFFYLLDEATSGEFLQGGPADAVNGTPGMLEETVWFRKKGDYTLGELLANKVEVLLWRGWHTDGGRGATKRRAKGELNASGSPLSCYLEDRRALQRFFFQDLLHPEARMQYWATAVAKATKTMLQHSEKEEQERDKRAANDREAFDACRYRLELVCTIMQLHLLGPAKRLTEVSTKEEALDRLFTMPLAECAVTPSFTQCRIQVLLRVELQEKRTLWHQQQLLTSFDAMERQDTLSAKTSKKNKKKKPRNNRVSLSPNSSSSSAAPVGLAAAPLTATPSISEDKEEVKGLPSFSSSPLALHETGAETSKGLKFERVNHRDNKDASGLEAGRAVSLVCRREMGTQTDCHAAGEENEDEEDTSSASYTGTAQADEEEEEEEEEEEDDDNNKEESFQCLDEQESGWTTREEHSCMSVAVAAHSNNVSNEALLKDLCLKLEAEVATLRGVLAAQRGALSQGGSGSISTSYPYSSTASTQGFAVPFGYSQADVHGRGPVNSHQHPLFPRHGPHHMEIMSDDGRGDGGGASSGGWQAGVPQPRAALASAHPFASSSTSTGNLYSADVTKHHAPNMSSTMRRRAHLEGGSSGPGPGTGIYAGSLPRNRSGPLQMWGEEGHHQHQHPPMHHHQLPHQHQSISASVSLGDDGGHYQHAVGSSYPLAPPLSSLHHEYSTQSGLDVSQHQTPAEAEECCTGFTLREPLLDIRSRICMDMAEFVRRVTETMASRLPQQRVAVNRCRQVVQSLWPRAQVKAFGSFVSGLALPSSDVDLVICLPKVRKDTPAEAPGVLEGRNAIKETWQQELARRLRGTVWVDPASIKIISHTAIPVIKMKMEPRASPGATTPATSGTSVPASRELLGGGKGGGSTRSNDNKNNNNKSLGKDGEEERDDEVYLDVSIEGGQHNGLLANRVIADLLRENPALRPLVLVLKHFMKERGLMESYSGGLSSYGLVLIVARYLQEQSPSMDTGSLLLGFLDFYSNHFDPRSMGISTNHRCFFSRGQLQSSSSASSSPLMHRRVSLGCGGELDVPEYYAPHSQPAQAQLRQVGPLLENPYKFDPLYIEDPICPSNNIGRNCFRIFQIQRAWNDVWRELDPSRKDGSPTLSRMLHQVPGQEGGGA